MWSFLKGENVILASASPRRRRILESAGLKFVQKPVDIEETIPNGRPPEEIAVELSYRKALAASKEEKDGWIITADTIVVRDGSVLGKPADREDAAHMLTRLSGSRHRVITGFTIVQVQADRFVSGFESTEVEFYPLTGEEINRYIDSGEPMDKAGAYGIQGKGGLFIKRIDGCYFNVVGLPIARLRKTWLEMFEHENYSHS